MNLEPLKSVECLGDKWHNESVERLFVGVDKRCKAYKKVTAILKTDNNNQRWLQNCLTVEEIQKFNALMKSKTEQTAVKRAKKIMERLAFGTYGGHIFNKGLL